MAKLTKAKKKLVFKLKEGHYPIGFPMYLSENATYKIKNGWVYFYD